MVSAHAGFRSLEHASEWFGQRRWYGDKGRQLVEIRSRFTVEEAVGSSRLVLEVLEIEFAAGESSRYVLVRDPGDVEVDRIEDVEVRAWFLRGFEEGRVLTQSPGELRWSTTDGLATEAGNIATSSRVFRGEQSNTSVVYSDTVMLKLFRKLQPGQNPEVEIGHHLTQNTDFSAFPRLLGSIDLTTNGELTTVAAAQQFIQSKGDAWSWMLDGLANDDFVDIVVQAASTLGRRTAEMHAALASAEKGEFLPEVVDNEYASAMQEESLRELDDTVSQLHARQIDDAHVLGESLKRSLVDLRHLQGTYRIRIHGDYHLGQVLRTTDEDFAILDFEGEPSRSLEERRAKASPLRDVAGMLHSFDYLAEAARRRYPYAEPKRFEALRRSARQAFTTGYTATVDGSALLAHGLDPQGRQRLLVAFEVHKSLYQARYELRNRPDWLDIQLAGLRRLAGTDQ